jgi:ATP-dependent exoDNAse (exonuclease V) beta subunit
VADLGRARWATHEVMRVGADGRFGMRIAEPGTGRKEPALHYRALGEDRLAAEEAEERRLFYVAMTRARERLVLSGAARLEGWPEGNGGTPIGWIASALIPDFAARIGEGSGLTERGVAFRFVREAGDDAEPGICAPPAAVLDTARALPVPAPPAPAAPAAPLSLSYSSLAAYERCGYRFYAERVLGLPPTPSAGVSLGSHAPAARPATERGVIAHALLEGLDFRRPLAPSAATLGRICAGRGLRAPDAAEADELAGLIRAFGDTDLCRRLGQATQVRREQRFSFASADDLLITGALDVVARERTGMLVVDYKSDRLGEASPAAVVASSYASQQLIYALAVLLSGASSVQVAHVFLERPSEPVIAAFGASDRPRLLARLDELTSGVRARRFEVTDEPRRAICDGCPAQGGLCSWPLAMTRREHADQLF